MKHLLTCFRNPHPEVRGIETHNEDTDECLNPIHACMYYEHEYCSACAYCRYTTAEKESA